MNLPKHENKQQNVSNVRVNSGPRHGRYCLALDVSRYSGLSHDLSQSPSEKNWTRVRVPTRVTQHWCQYRKPAHEGDSPSRGGFPLKRGTVRLSPSKGFFSLCQICKIAKKRQCLWRFMGPLFMHQFIEISICGMRWKIKILYVPTHR